MRYTWPCLTLPTPQIGKILEGPVGSEEPCFLIPQEEDKTLFLKNHTCLSKPVWDSLQDWCKVLTFVFHNLELTRDKKAADISQTFVRQRSKLQPPEGQDYSWHRQGNTERLGGKARTEVSVGNWGLQKNLCVLKKVSSHKLAQCCTRVHEP